MAHEHTVLFVDDEVNILKALQRLLRMENMNVICAARASEALDLLERPGLVGLDDEVAPGASASDRIPPVSR